MDRQELMGRIQSAFRQILSNPTLIITDDSSAATVDNWDSMNHIRLIAMLEKEFKCKFRLGELQQLQNVGGLADILMTKIH